MTINISKSISPKGTDPNSVIVARFKDGSKITVDCFWEDSGFIKRGDEIFSFLFRGLDPDNPERNEKSENLHNQIKECMGNKDLDGTIKIAKKDNLKVWRKIQVEMMLGEVYALPPPPLILALLKPKVKM